MHKIEIFHVEGQDAVTLGAACGSCSSGCEPITHSISTTIKEFEDKYASEASIKRVELHEENIDSVAKRLQALYQNSGEQLIITASNVKFILGRLSPIIAINDRLAANNYVPDAEELKLAMDNDMGIYSNICS